MGEKDLTQWKELESIAEAAGITYEYGAIPTSGPSSSPYLRLELPAYKSAARSLFCFEEDVPAVIEEGLDGVVFLGNLAACLDTKRGIIEALFRPAMRHPNRGANIHELLARFGTDEKGSRPMQSDPSVSGDEVDDIFNRVESEVISLTLGGGALKAEFSKCSPLLLLAEYPRTLRRGALSLKVAFSPDTSHDEAHNQLTTFAAALFFELDVNYGIILSLAESRLSRRASASQSPIRQEATTRPPMVPRQVYNEDAVSLYTYGRSAQGMPLLEYLAYYQVMEYFFPTYARAELVQRFRRELRDPRFDPASDTDVGRLIQILSGSGRGRLEELDQLKATLQHCVDEQALRDFVESEPERLESLTGKQNIKGIKNLDLRNKQQLITDQVADRVYQIRCRIVHSKENGGPRNEDIILPFSAESRKLSADLTLARFLAQKVLVMAAKPAPWLG